MIRVQFEPLSYIDFLEPQGTNVQDGMRTHIELGGYGARLLAPELDGLGYVARVQVR